MKFRVIVFLVAALVSLGILHAREPGRRASRFPSVGRAAVLWHRAASGADSLDQESFGAALRSMGISFAKINPADIRADQLDSTLLLVVPHASAAALSNAEAKVIAAGVQRGVRLVTDGRSSLTDLLRIQVSSGLSVKTVLDQMLPEIRLSWSDRPSVQWISDCPKLDSKALYVDSASRRALAVGIRSGQGRCIVLAPLFDPVSAQGYSRFPTLSNAIFRFLEWEPMFTRQALDAYFDPGYRFAIPIEKLAAQWRSWGIRAVHAAAWYDGDSLPYNYRRLIDAAHKNGILVYAWLEWPHLGRGFWNKHPEWRQKNALLQDAKLDFLHLMDLQNPDCLLAALNNLGNLLKDDWDGIDIAEFTITGAGGEALDGPTRLDHFVPFTASAIAEFKTYSGFDPLELVNPSSRHFWKRDSASLDQFYRFRTNVNNRLLRQVVEFVNAMKLEKKRDWELIHTIVDNSLHPEFDYLLGFDQAATLHLLRKHNVTLNVEDPYMEWLQPPDRYRRLRTTLVRLMPERPAMIDINVVPTHPSSQSGFASEQATGIEFLQQLQYAGEQGGRVCVYCESSVFSHDWQLAPHAMAVGASATKSGKGWEVKSETTVTLNIAEASHDVLVDGQRWPCMGSDGIVLPAGVHRVSIEQHGWELNSANEELRLLSLSDELIGCKSTDVGLDLQYRSIARCLLTFNMPVKSVLVDGALANLPILKADGKFVIIAPSGTHRLSVVH
jgi:hypothetical protein